MRAWALRRHYNRPVQRHTLTFGQRIRPHVDVELRAAAQAEARGSGVAFAHLERAHTLGQASTVQHVWVHWHMLRWALRHRNVRECVGQITRIIGAATKTAIGFIPSGNTGGANVSPFRPMPVPVELEALIRQAEKGTEDA